MLLESKKARCNTHLEQSYVHIAGLQLAYGQEAINFQSYKYNTTLGAAETGLKQVTLSSFQSKTCLPEKITTILAEFMRRDMRPKQAYLKT